VYSEVSLEEEVLSALTFTRGYGGGTRICWLSCIVRCSMTLGAESCQRDYLLVAALSQMSTKSSTAQTGDAVQPKRFASVQGSSEPKDEDLWE
jgi:hypothetical protein